MNLQLKANIYLMPTIKETPNNSWNTIHAVPYLREGGIFCTERSQLCCWQTPWKHPVPCRQCPVPGGNLVHGPAAGGLFAREISSEVTDPILSLASVIWIQNECVYKGHREWEHLLYALQEYRLVTLELLFSDYQTISNCQYISWIILSY